MAEVNDNVWAPWRMEYIAGLEREHRAGSCFLCCYRDAPKDDQQNHVLWRSERTLTLLNRYPYTTGHLLLAPLDHLQALEELTDDVLMELTLRIRDAKVVLQGALHPEGFNIGMNLGRCAGAGLPHHIHWHIVPRWTGDTNFMTVTGPVRVMPDSLQAVYEKFQAAAAAAGLSNP